VGTGPPCPAGVLTHSLGIHSDHQADFIVRKHHMGPEGSLASSQGPEVTAPWWIQGDALLLQGECGQGTTDLGSRVRHTLLQTALKALVKWCCDVCPST
jgi:hypothetical protein